MSKIKFFISMCLFSAISSISGNYGYRSAVKYIDYSKAKELDEILISKKSFYEKYTYMNDLKKKYGENKYNKIIKLREKIDLERKLNEIKD